MNFQNFPKPLLGGGHALFCTFSCSQRHKSGGCESSRGTSPPGAPIFSVRQACGPEPRGSRLHGPTSGHQSALLRGCGMRVGGRHHKGVRPSPPPGGGSHTPGHSQLGLGARVQADRGYRGESGDLGTQPAVLPPNHPGSLDHPGPLGTLPTTPSSKLGPKAKASRSSFRAVRGPGRAGGCRCGHLGTEGACGPLACSLRARGRGTFGGSIVGG